MDIERLASAIITLIFVAAAAATLITGGYMIAGNGGALLALGFFLTISEVAHRVERAIARRFR